MEIKKQLLKKVGNLESIKCITADLINATSVKESLLKASWNKTAPTLVIAEGISYYLSEKDLWNIINIFKSQDTSNELILEYLLPYELVNKKHRHIAEKVFEKLEKDYNLSDIVHYSEDLIKNKLRQVPGVLSKTLDFLQIEKERLGKNSLFTEKKDGWIEISNIKI